MDVLLAMKAAVRRWYVAVPMLLVTVAFAAYSFLHAASAWQTSGSLLIIPPLAPTNTIVDYGGTRLQAALLADNFNSDVVQTSLSAKGASGVFEAKASNELPLVSVTVQANKADAAARTLKIVLDNGDAVLADVQHRIGTDKANYYRTVRSVEDASPKFSASSRLVGAIGILIGGTGLTILLSAVVDGLVTRRHRADPERGRAPRHDHQHPADAHRNGGPMTAGQPEVSPHPTPPQPRQPAALPAAPPADAPGAEGLNGTPDTGYQTP